MSIEEKAKENATKYAPDLNYNQQYMKCGFRLGAGWMLEKAAYWLQEHVNNYLFDDGTPDRPWLKYKSDMFDDFRKAMEE